MKFATLLTIVVVFITNSLLGQTLDRQVVTGYVAISTAVVGGVNSSAYRLDNFSSSELILISGFEQTDSVEIVSVSERELSISAYPNPFIQSVFLNPLSDEELNLVVMDAMGKMIEKISFIGSTEIKLNHLKAGMYFFVFANSKGVKSSIKLMKLN